ncbi:hypothetical protein LSAT2_020494 [Lamellibrachia satsuma]|nr:hypothetical protein LSAT2_020494 [Lamellibrachia satsuma]
MARLAMVSKPRHLSSGNASANALGDFWGVLAALVNVDDGKTCVNVTDILVSRKTMVCATEVFSMALVNVKVSEYINGHHETAKLIAQQHEAGNLEYTTRGPTNLGSADDHLTTLRKWRYTDETQSTKFDCGKDQNATPPLLPTAKQRHASENGNTSCEGHDNFLMDICQPRKAYRYVRST